MNVLGYVRVSTASQMAKAQSLVIQTTAIAQESARRGWTLVGVVNDPAKSAGTLDRPALLSALRQLRYGEANVLMASHLDRITRSVHDLDVLFAWLDEAERRIVTVDDDIDTSVPAKRNMAQVWASFAQIDRTRVSERTKQGLEATRARGKRVGRPAVADQPDLASRIRALDAQGMSYHAIARLLHDEGVPTVRGGLKWRASSVQGVLGYRRPTRRRRPVRLPGAATGD